MSATATPPVKPETAPAVRTDPLKTAQNFVAQHSKAIQSVISKHMTPERVFRIAAMSISRSQKLVEACMQSPASLVDSLIKITQWGLEVNGRDAHLVPFKNRRTGKLEIQAIIDYKGMVTLTRRSGEIASIHADVVCQNDDFSFSYGTDGHLSHKPARTNAGDVIWVYSYVKLKDGSEDYSVMSVEECDDIRRESQSGYDREKECFTGIHAEWPNEMRKKTVFRRHTKWLPISAELVEALATDGDNSEDVRFAKAKQAREDVKPPNFLGAPARQSLPEPAENPLNGTQAHEREMQPVQASNETDDHPPGLEPESARAVPIPPLPEAPSPQERVAHFAAELGLSFDAFRTWMDSLGASWLGDSSSLGSFDDIPVSKANKINAAQRALREMHAKAVREEVV